MRFITCTAMGAVALGMLAPILGYAAPSAAQPVRALGDSSRPGEAAQTVISNVVVGGRNIEYAGTFGTLTITDDAGAPTASMFYAAYVSRKPEPTRPVTFIYNGGPGSPSAFLHIASFGPVRLDLGTIVSEGRIPAGGLRLLPNPASLLDVSDLVFIDAVETGFSRAAAGVSAKRFFGVDQDIDAFARAIKRWLSLNGRWTSPKLLLGESYGGTRSAGLAAILPERGVSLDGIILLNGGLDRVIRDPYNDAFYVTLLPTYAATAWYHKRLVTHPANLEALMEEVRRYAQGPYSHALQLGNRLPPGERAEVAQKVAALSGLSTEFVLANDLRVDVDKYRKELLRSERRLVGQLDTRITGPEENPSVDDSDGDPAFAALYSAFEPAINDYLLQSIGYRTQLEYRMSAPEAQPSWIWTRSRGRESFPWVNRPITVDLAEALRNNARMKVFVALSYFDLAVPFGVTEYDLTHLRLDPTLANNINIHYYEQGHMIYTQTAGLRQLVSDLSAFYRSLAAAPGNLHRDR